jgi:hypothetical protein
VSSWAARNGHEAVVAPLFDDDAETHDKAKARAGAKANGEAEIHEDDLLRLRFRYDITIFRPEDHRDVYRGLLLDYKLPLDAIFDEMPPVLGLALQPYTGSEVQLPNQ